MYEVRTKFSKHELFVQFSTCIYVCVHTCTHTHLEVLIFLAHVPSCCVTQLVRSSRSATLLKYYSSTRYYRMLNDEVHDRHAPARGGGE
jgi:hypothetical protein